MKRFNGKTRWLAATVLVVSAAAAWADADPSRYTSIVDRNPFGLKPPPPPPDPASLTPPPPPPQLATVELTGVTSILSSKRAILEIIPGPGKQMLKPVLSEGEKLETIEVVSIDIDKGQVVIKNGTLVTNLSIKVAAKGPTQPIPGQPGGGVAGIVPAGIHPTPTHAAVNYSQPPSGRSGVIMTGGTPAYEPPAAGGVSPLGQAVQPVNPAAAGFRSIPSRAIRSGGLPQPSVPNAPMSPEAAAIEVERNRQINPAYFPPLPPTPLTPHLPPPPGQ